MIQWLLATWSLVLLSFLNPACTSGNSWFTYCSNLTWISLSIILLACEMSVSSVQTLSHVWLFATPWTTAHQVHHQLPEFTQTYVHRVDDAIQPSHPLSSPSPHALNVSQLQGLFKWGSSSHQAAKVLEFQLQHQSFQWTPRTDLL